MKKVGILGGTFNPPHMGHLICANEAFHALKLDEVRFMPNAIAPHKQQKGDVTTVQRLQMVEIMAKPYPNFKVETIEVERGGISYTFHTMEELCQREPDVEFYLIIGGDMIDTLHTWYEIEELSKLVKFVGFNRPGSAASTNLMIEMIDAPEINLSSTMIRQRLASGGTLRFLLPEGVEAFIRKEGLYGTG